MKHTTKSKTIWAEAQTLRPHPIAQRELKVAHLRDLRASFDLDAIGVIHCVEYEIERETALWIIDGQHRWRVLMDEGFGEWGVEVKVHLDVDSDERASELFLKLNHRKPVSPLDKFKNELTAGLPVANNIVEILKTRGVKVGTGTYEGTVTCVASLKAVYLLDEGRSLGLAMDTIIPAWGKGAAALEGKLIEGFGKIYSIYNGTIDRPSFVKKLAKYPGGPSGLLGDARGLKEHTKASVGHCVAVTLVSRYNSGRAAGRLDPL